MNKTAIQWTNHTWNPTTGCDKISPGCRFCYAESVTERWPKGWPNGFKFTIHPNRFRDPFKVRTPSLIFVDSMSDLFHKDVPDDYVRNVLRVMQLANWHTYQVLTKRSERLRDFLQATPEAGQQRHG